MTKKPLLASLTSDDDAGNPAAVEKPMLKPKFGTSAVAVGNIGRAFALQGEGRVIDIDPMLVAPSPFNDRLEMDESALDGLVRSITAEGQRMPVLARPHPTESGRYQLAYGHRRLKAILRIRETVQGKETLPLKAFIVAMSDLELAERQASENIDRADLTWVDQALFLAGLEASGETMKKDAEKILRLDRTVAWRMRSVVSSIPIEVIRGIGSAPKVGMPRWIVLAELFDKAPEKALEVASAMIVRLDEAEAIKTEKTMNDRSSRRFLAVFRAVRDAIEGVRKRDMPMTTGRPDLKISKTAIRLPIPKDQKAFGDWFETRFDALWQEYLETTKD